MKKIINGKIIGPDCLHTGKQLLVRDGKILDILPDNAGLPEGFGNGAVRIIDAEGGYVVPGFIDVHSDYIEHMASPRPNCLIDFDIAILEFERELLTHGITTMYHSISFYRSTEFPEKEVRLPRNTKRFVDLIDKANKNRRLLRHKFHARFEIDSLERIKELETYILENKAHLLSFMDHTPGQGQYRDLGHFRQAVKGYRKVSDAEIDVMIEKSQAKEKLTIEAITELIYLAQKAGISVAAHDDDSPGRVEFNKSLGMKISEFPITMETALKARELGLHTVGGAPNVMLKGSHSGNLSAAEAILAGAVDALCSDYYPASLLHAVFMLHEVYGLDLPEAFRLITLNPAKAVGIDGEFGSIEPGKEADFLIIKRLDGSLPVVSRAFISGDESMAFNYGAGN